SATGQCGTWRSSSNASTSEVLFPRLSDVGGGHGRHGQSATRSGETGHSTSDQDAKNGRNLPAVFLSSDDRSHDCNPAIRGWRRCCGYAAVLVAEFGAVTVIHLLSSA